MRQRKDPQRQPAKRVFNVLLREWNRRSRQVAFGPVCVALSGMTRRAGNCLGPRCLRRDLYGEPTSETQPSWPFRPVAAVSSPGGDPILVWRCEHASGKPGTDQHSSVSERYLLLFWKHNLYPVPRQLICLVQPGTCGLRGASVPPAPQRSISGGVCISALPFLAVSGSLRSFPRTTFTPQRLWLCPPSSSRFAHFRQPWRPLLSVECPVE